MATTLRELIVKVVFRADPKQLQDFDDLLAQAKAKLVALDEQAKKGVTPAVDPTPLQRFGAQLQATAAEMLALKGVGASVGEKLGASTRTAGESFIALRDAVQSIDGALDPAKVEEFSAAFTEAQQTADDLRNAINRLRLTDPKNAELPALEAQLKAVEFEAEQTARALKGVGVATKAAAPATSQMSSGLGNLTKLLGGLGVAATAYKVIDWGKRIMSDAAAVGDLAARLSIGTDELQQWTAFAQQAGSSSEDLAGTVKSLSKNIQNAAEDAKGPAAEGFKRLGISTAGWKDTLPSTTDLLLTAGGALGELTNSTERMALAQELLGEAGLKMLPAFAGGTKAAKDQLDALKDLAVVYDEEFIKSASAAQNEMALFERQMDGVGSQVVLAVLPSIRQLVRWLTPLARDARKLVGTSNILQAAFISLGAAGVGALITKFGGLGKVLKTGAKAMLQFVIPMLILDDIISLMKGEGSVIGDALEDLFGAGTTDTTRKAILSIFEGFKELAAFLKGDTSADQFFEKFIKGTAPVQDAIDGMVAYIKTKIDELLGYTTKSIADAGTNLLGRVAGEIVGITPDSVRQGRAAAGLNPDTAERLDGRDNREAFLQDNPTIGPIVDWFADVTGFKEDILAARAAAAKDQVQPTLPSAEQMARNGQAGLALGGAPAVSNSKATTVTVNDNSSVNTTLNGVNGENVGAALKVSEKNVSEQLKRNKAQVLRQTVGAASI